MQGVLLKMFDFFAIFPIFSQFVKNDKKLLTKKTKYDIISKV